MSCRQHRPRSFNSTKCKLHNFQRINAKQKLHKLKDDKGCKIAGYLSNPLKVVLCDGQVTTCSIFLSVKNEVNERQQCIFTAAEKHSFCCPGHLLKICLDKLYPLKLFIFVALLFVVQLCPTPAPLRLTVKDEKCIRSETDTSAKQLRRIF